VQKKEPASWIRSATHQREGPEPPRGHNSNWPGSITIDNSQHFTKVLYQLQGLDHERKRIRVQVSSRKAGK
jgi:hypothetical protein